jgi:hypothetical protein
MVGILICQQPWKTIHKLNQQFQSAYGNFLFPNNCYYYLYSMENNINRIYILWKKLNVDTEHKS